jgi:hypothetical protein
MLMTRFIATVEFQDGEYWISFPGIEKTYRLAKQPEDIVLQARAFLDQQAKPVSVAGTMIDADLPPSLDDALTPGTPIEPFEGVRLVIFEWDPPS